MLVNEEEGERLETDIDFINLQDAKLHDIIFINYGVEFKRV